MQRDHQRPIARAAFAGGRKRRVNRNAQRFDALAIRRNRPFRHLRGIDRSEENGDFLVGQTWRRQVAEQLGQRGRRDTDLLRAFAPCRQRLARLDATGHDLDHVAAAIGEMRRQPKLAN